MGWVFAVFALCGVVGAVELVAPVTLSSTLSKEDLVVDVDDLLLLFRAVCGSMRTPDLCCANNPRISVNVTTPIRVPERPYSCCIVVESERTFSIVDGCAGPCDVGAEDVDRACAVEDLDSTIHNL